MVIRRQKISQETNLINFFSTCYREYIYHVTVLGSSKKIVRYKEVLVIKICEALEFGNRYS